jgi:hypothetical protein
MEILKSSLKQIPEADRVKGRVYGVDESISGTLDCVAIYGGFNKSIRNVEWKRWFELPESMLPVREVMPEEFELKQGEWEYDSPLHECWSDISKLTISDSIRFRRFKVIPPQSRSIPHYPCWHEGGAIGVLEGCDCDI